MRPILYDLFSGAGGAAKGYMGAGFEVWGVDIKPQPRYPGARFIQTDAFDFIRAVMAGEYPMPDAWHASPPCQAYTPLRALQGDREYPDHVAATRALLVATGLPYVIENVVQAPIRPDIVLCGATFGLRVYRHRAFESNLLLLAPAHQVHKAPTAWGRDRKRRYLTGTHFLSVTGDVGRYAGDAMGIDWMTGDELSQAVPPAYTALIGAQLLAALGATEAVS